MKKNKEHLSGRQVKQNIKNWFKKVHVYILDHNPFGMSPKRLQRLKAIEDHNNDITRQDRLKIAKKLNLEKITKSADRYSKGIDEPKEKLEVAAYSFGKHLIPTAYASLYSTIIYVILFLIYIILSSVFGLFYVASIVFLALSLASLLSVIISAYFLFPIFEIGMERYLIVLQTLTPETYVDSEHVIGTHDVPHGEGFKRVEYDAEPLDKVIGDNSDNIIELKHVQVAFKRGIDERIVIQDFSLNIKRGEIFGLVGESGSGKTTIGRTMMRIVPIKKGEIRYNGHLISGKLTNARSRELKQKIQMIFQDPSASLNDRANVDYIISEGIKAFHMYDNEEERLEKVMKMVDRVGLRPEHLKRYPHEFSGGQRQRIGIARSIIMDPEVIVADEPISALDVSIRAQVLNLIKEFQVEHNMTVIFIAHDLSVVKYISDRIGVIYDGRLLELADANRLFEMPLHPYTKSLLSAVPIPDPRVEKKKKIITYNPMMHHYRYDDLPELYEVEPNHFVRANKRELEEYKAVIAAERKTEE